MLAHYALTLYRSLTRHRLYAAINVLGLAVGVAVFLVLAMLVRRENSYDAWLPGADKVRLLTLTYLRPGAPPEKTYVTPGVVLPLLRQDYPQIAAGTRLMNVGADAFVAGRERIGLNLGLVDAEFGRVFPLPMLAGDLASLHDPAAVAVSAGAARRLFGATNVLGRALPLTVDGRVYGFRVTAVFRDRPDTSMLNEPQALTQLRPQLATSTEGALTRWSQSSMLTAVRIDHAADAAAISADLPAFVARRGPREEMGEHPEQGVRAALQPLRTVHFDVKARGLRQPTVDGAVVAGMTVLGIATLLLAVVNAVNLATARAGLRAREVALRRTLGASRRALFIQFMAEGAVVSAVSVLIGLSLTELTLPGVNALLGSNLRLNYLGPEGLAPTLAGLVVLVTVLSSAYPALVLSRVQPAAVLAAVRSPGGGRNAGRVRAGLVGLQFAASIALMVCTVVALDQAAYERRADPGFLRTDLFQVEGGDAPEFAARRGALLDTLKATPGVSAVAVTDRGPQNENASSSNVGRPGRGGREPVLVFESTGGDYLHAYGGRLLAGRWFDPHRGLDDRRGEKVRADMNVVLNRSGADALGFATPAAAVGRTVLYGGSTPMRVVGVTEDLRFLGPRQKVNPAVYVYDSTFERGGRVNDWIVAVRGGGVAEPVLKARIATVLRRFSPDGRLRVRPVTAVLESYYRPDERRSRLFAAAAALAVALGCVGLYGLAAFTTARRTREIGIRKALGASTAEVMRLLTGEFLQPVLWANLAAWPLAWVAMRAWLSGFDQRIALGPQYFVGASLVALAVAALTVAGQALRVARAEPARALRHE